MALLERLAILITADAAGAINEMKKVADTAEKDLGKAGAAGQNLSGQMTKVGAAMLGAGAGLLAVGAASADTATSLGREVSKLQRYTGMAAEEASKLAFAAKNSGVPVDSLTVGLGKLSKQMEANSPTFDKMGLSVHDSNGKLRSLGEVLPDLAEKFKNMPNGPEKTALALQLFGRSGMDLMPFLNKGKEGIEALSKEAEKMGLVLSQDNIDAIKHHIQSQRDLSAAFDGIKTQIGLTMIPVLDTLTDTFKNMPGPVNEVIGPLVVFGGLGLVVAGGISLIVGQVKSFITIAKSAYEGAANLVTKFMAMPAALGIAAVGVAAIAGAFLLLKGHLNDVSENAKKAQGDLSGLSVDELKRKIADVNSEMASLAPKEKEWILMGAEAIRRSTTGDDERYAKLQGTKAALEEALAAANNSIGPTKTLADAEKAAADETTNHALAAQQLNDVLKKSLDPFLNAIDAAKKDEEAQKKAAEAKLKVFFSQIALNDAIKNFGMNSPQAIKAAQDLADANSNLDSAQSGAFSAAITLEQNIGTLKAAMKDHPEIYQQNIDKINAMEKAHQIDTDTADRMRKKLYEVAITAGLIPPNVSTTVTANTEEAKAKLESIRNTIHDILNLTSANGTFGKGLGVLVSNPTPGVDLSFLNPKGSAIGGRTSTPRLVGELGPEIFWPDSAGTIVTAEKTKQMLSSSGGGNTAVYNINVNVSTTADKAAVGQSIVEAIAAYERRSGDGWRAA